MVEWKCSVGLFVDLFCLEKVAFSDAHHLFHGHDEGIQNGQVGQVKEENRQQMQMVGKSAVILLGALAVHSVLEMTALGLANTFGDSALLSLSIALHPTRRIDCSLRGLFEIGHVQTKN